MPGHKLNPRFLYNGIVSADITEINGADVLCAPSGVLNSLQKQLALLFGAGESFILTNGSTCGVIAAILSVCKQNDTIIAARNAHKSFFAGIELCGANPVYISPEITEYGFAGSVSPQLVERALTENSGAKAVFITSPTYEGVVSDVAAISRITKKYGATLIVDEAHGAHFTFSNYFPKTALELGADIVVQSLHKTLPALTQTAVLHVKQGLNSASLKRRIHMLQTSSPSYMFMAQVDFMACMMESRAGDLFAKYVGILRQFRENVGKLENVQLIGKKIMNVFDIDLGKLVFYCKGNGVWLEKHLRVHSGVQVEAAFDDYIIAMTSVADTAEGFNILLEGLKKADCRVLPFQRKAKNGAVKLEQYIGKISAGIIAPFPPGIPLVAPGEVLTESTLNTVTKLIECGTVVSGVSKKNEQYFIEIRD